MPDPMVSRRSLLRAALASTASLALGGCDGLDFLRDRENAMRRFMIGFNSLTYRTQRLLLSPGQLAPEFSQSDIRQSPHPNGSVAPDTTEYRRLQAKGFSDYRLEVGGLVREPAAFTLNELRRMPYRTQITRHDCVEGWSCIAKWQGVPLSRVLEAAGVQPQARFVVFHCFDPIEKSLSGEVRYYESIDLVDAFHPQTILAYAVNDEPLPIANGAPLRVRVERQLGYKMAKYIRKIELVADFTGIGQGMGSYWADRGYEWYAGI
jgi:DMSO/TMAO reductase YedYZ molybdopterin-dependent catalytic subunit